MAVNPSPADLISLAYAKAWANLGGSTTNDDVLRRLITGASRFILTYLSRGSILPAAYSDTYDTYSSTKTLIIRRWPVISVEAMMIGTTTIPAGTPISPSNPTVPNGRILSGYDGAPPGAPQWIELYGYGFFAGIGNVLLNYTAGYAISDEPLTLGGDTPMAFTSDVLVQPYGIWASDFRVKLANGTLLTKVGTNPQAGEYTVAVDKDSGVATYTFNAAQSGAALLVSYGYIPADLAQACAELVAVRYAERERPGVISKSLGGQETMSYSQKDMADDVRTSLNAYRNVVTL